jgi:glycosyltransferase involved in cell wall biosynthesis
VTGNLSDISAPLRVFGVDLDPIGDFRTANSRNAGLYRALDEISSVDVVDVVSVKLPTIHSRLIQLAYVRKGRDRWRQRAGLSTVAFRARTNKLDRELRRYDGTYDVILQLGCVFAPGRLGRRRAYVLYLDSNLILNHREWPPAIPLGRTALAGWVRLERQVYERAQHIFTMSDWARNSMLDDYGIDPSRVSTVGAGTNLVPAELPERDWSDPVALFVGLEFDRKGGRELLAAWPSVSERVPGAKLWIVGTRGEHREEAGITWFGRIAADELRSLYARATVFVLPSRYDMFPHVLREALGSGLPCVTTNTGAISEIVRDKVDSLLVPPRDVASLATALTEVLSDPGRAQEMGQAGRARVLEQDSWESVARRMMPKLRAAAGQPDPVTS